MFKKVWNIISGIIIALLLVLALLLAGSKLFGMRLYTVLSGSMEPTYHVGSLIYVKSVDYHELKVGDSITFMLDEETIATHRIVEVVPDEEDPEVIRYKTKGDANDVEDGGLVHYKNVIGRPVFTIPYLGYLVSYVKEPPGMYIAISVVAFLLILFFLPELLGALSGDKDKEQEKAEKDVVDIENKNKE